MFEPEPPAHAPTPRLAALIALVFACLVAAGLARHEMWLDELQAWLLAFRAGSPLDVLRNLAYEGHPPLWHLALHAAGRLWPRPEAMQVVSGLLATTTVFLVTWRSPLSPLQKAIFAAGYFPLFEYGVVARNYGMGFTCLAAFAAMRWSGVRSLALLALPLVGLGLTSIFGLIVAWAVAVAIAVDAWDDPAAGRGWKDLAAGAAIFALGTLATLKLMIPPPDATFASGWRWGHDGWFTSAIIGVWRAFVPVPAWGDPYPWNTNLLQPDLIPVEFQLSGLLLLVASASLRHAPGALAGWLAGATVMIVFTWLRWGEALRHAGHFFLLWLACQWIARPATGRAAALVRRLVEGLRSPAPAEPSVLGPILAGAAVALGTVGMGRAGFAYMLGLALAAIVLSLGPLPGLRRLWAFSDGLRPGGFALSVLLTIHAGVGLRFWATDLQRPFSSGKALAATIAALPGGPYPVAIADARYVNTIGPVVAAYLGREVTYVGATRARDGSFLVWNRDRPPNFDAAPEMPKVVARMADLVRPGQPTLFVVEVPVERFPPTIEARIVAEAAGAMQGEEPRGYTVYELRRKP